MSKYAVGERKWLLKNKKYGNLVIPEAIIEVEILAYDESNFAGDSYKINLVSDEFDENWVEADTLLPSKEVAIEAANKRFDEAYRVLKEDTIELTRRETLFAQWQKS